MPNNLGFSVDTDDEIRKDAFLFGEAQGRVVVSIKPENQEDFVEFMATSDTEFSLLGTVTAGNLLVDEQSFGTVLASEHIYNNVLGNILNN